MLSGPWKQGLGPLLGRDYNLGTCASKGEYTAASALLQTLLVDREDHVATHARCKVMSYATRTFAPDPSLRWVPLLQALGPTSTARLKTPRCPDDLGAQAEAPAAEVGRRG